jgi:hypothetical protein
VLYRVSAEGDGPLRLAEPETDLRLEPLSVFVDQGNQCDRRAADVRREQREVVERGLRIGVEDAIAPEGGQAALFVGGHTVLARSDTVRDAGIGHQVPRRC